MPVPAGPQEPEDQDSVLPESTLMRTLYGPHSLVSEGFGAGNQEKADSASKLGPMRHYRQFLDGTPADFQTAFTFRCSPCLAQNRHYLSSFQRLGRPGLKKARDLPGDSVETSRLGLWMPRG